MRGARSSPQVKAGSITRQRGMNGALSRSSKVRSSPVSMLIAEHGRIPVEIADHGLGVGIEQELVRIEAMAVAPARRAVHAIAVDRAGPRVRQKAVPDFVGEFRQLDALDLAFAADRRTGTARPWWRWRKTARS